TCSRRGTARCGPSAAGPRHRCGTGCPRCGPGSASRSRWCSTTPPERTEEDVIDSLFPDDAVARPRRELAPGAVHVPGWLTLAQQRWIVDRFREWAAGPVPPRAAKVRGHEMSVRTVCLGWH